MAGSVSRSKYGKGAFEERFSFVGASARGQELRKVGPCYGCDRSPRPGDALTDGNRFPIKRLRLFIFLLQVIHTSQCAEAFRMLEGSGVGSRRCPLGERFG